MSKTEKEELAEIKKLAVENHDLISKNTKAINENFEKIKQNKFALDILKDYKHEAIIWKAAFFITLALLIVVCVHHFILK